MLNGASRQCVRGGCRLGGDLVRRVPKTLMDSTDELLRPVVIEYAVVLEHNIAAKTNCARICH